MTRIMKRRKSDFVIELTTWYWVCLAYNLLKEKKPLEGGKCGNVKPETVMLLVGVRWIAAGGFYRRVVVIGICVWRI